ncbi:MAG TPA: FAD:protein FMN transferase [Myxococcota bacterium]|nr:FAD:protein FMN transferase [Myxococcota bacterium]
MSAPGLEPYRHVWRAMGSPCELALCARSEPHARDVAKQAAAEVERLEALYSRYRESSLLSEINRTAARGGSISVDPETASLLAYADACHRESGGLFDVTSGILRRAWRFQGQDALPEPGQVQALLERVGWQRVSWKTPVLSFPCAGMELDLGGVVKEYAVDRVSALCRELGAGGGLVNLGGDVGAIGPRPDGGPWHVGIRHPRRPGELVSRVALERGALASSGDYERCVLIGGVRYGHILSPRTGWPVRRMAAVSVAAELCVVAGSAATIAMLKEDAGPAWLARLGLPHLWSDVEGEVGGPLSASPGR